MRRPMKILTVLSLAWLAAAVSVAAAAEDKIEDKIAVVAAENFYGDVARQIGGDRVSVVSILSNPDQDPHLFEVSPAVVRQIAAVQVVVFNGAGYDPWIEQILKAATHPGRIVISAAELMHRKSGDNPHLWYDPATMPAVARALAGAFASADPAHKDEYAARLATFLAALAPVDAKIAAIRDKFAGTTVTATEPVFGYMAQALKLSMTNERFQLAIMNDTEPSARDVAAFERDLKDHKVHVLFYNKQAPTALVEHLIALAHDANIPVVGITETAPAGVSYQNWMLQQLDETGRALAGSSS
jgi:zinc/manganese transport system substrate-binding protein